MQNKLGSEDSTSLKEFIKRLAATANNIIMKGSYMGDDIHVASRFMNQCQTIVELLEDEKQKTK